MEIEKSCDAFCKLAYVLFGLDANKIKQQIVDMLKSAISAASSQGKFNPDPISKIGVEFPDLSFDISIDGQDGRNITISDFYINTTDQAILDKYRQFQVVLKEYLEKYWELLPKQHEGKDIKYDNFTARVIFP